MSFWFFPPPFIERVVQTCAQDCAKPFRCCRKDSGNTGYFAEPNRNTMEDAFGIGDKLKELRHEKKYTLERVADELGVPKSTYHDYEQGHSVPQIDFLQRAAAYYQKDPMIFFNGQRLTFNQENNQVANGYIHTQESVDPGLVKKLLDHIEARSSKTEELFAKALDVLGRFGERKE